MSLVTLKKSHIGTELLVLKARLESEGIRCYLKNEYTTQIMNYMPTFEVELQVSELDLKAAIKIMQENEPDLS